MLNTEQKAAVLWDNIISLAVSLEFAPTEVIEELREIVASEDYFHEDFEKSFIAAVFTYKSSTNSAYEERNDG